MTMRKESGLARRGDTSIGRISPWAELEQMRNRMDDLFSRVFGYTPLSTMIGPSTFTPAVDICESSENLLVNVYIPGLSKEDVELNVTQDTLSISGEWKHPHIEGENVVCHVTGFGTGRFEASYDLPADIDPKGTKATYRNGVLGITLPKTEASKSRAIKVEVEET